MNAGGVDKACKSNDQMSDFGGQISDVILNLMDVINLRVYAKSLELLPEVYELSSRQGV